MTPELQQLREFTRRHFLERCHLGLANMFLASMARGAASDPDNPLAPKKPEHAPKAKSIIYLHMAGSPSQLELWDYKPELQKYDGKDCPQNLLEEAIRIHQGSAQAACDAVSVPAAWAIGGMDERVAAEFREGGG